MASFLQYTADGADTKTGIAIPTFKKEEIKVRVDGVLKTEGSGQDYEITSYSTSSFTINWKDTARPADPSIVRVYRDTDILNAGDTDVEGKATYQAGSSVKSGDLNDNQKQALRALEEKDDQLLQTWDIEPGAVDVTALANNSVTSAKIVNNTIVDEDISTTAEVQVSKLKNGTARQVLQTATDGSTVEWTSNVDIPGTLDVQGNTKLEGNLDVTGTLDVNSAVTIAGVTGIDGNFDINTNKFTVDAASGNTTIAGTLDVTGTTAFNGQHTISSGALLNNVRVGLDASQEISTASGNLTLDSAGGNVVVDDNLSVNETISANAINAAGAVGVDGNFDVNTNKFTVAASSGNTTIAGTLGVTGSSSFTNAITGLNGAVIDNIYIGISSDSEIDTSSGNLTLDSAGGTVVVDDNLSVNGTTSANAINAAGAVNVTGNLAINTNKFNINATSGDTTVAGTLGVTGQITGNVTGNITGNVTGSATSISGVDATTDELNILDGVTANKDELNLLDGKSIVESISASSTNTQLPTALAVDTRITNLVTDVGGFRPIANETSFPSTNPDPEDNAGTIVSIKALSQSFTTDSGVTTKVFTDGAGSGNDVTITGLTQSTTYPQGRGMLLETTSTLHTYTFHRLTLDETGVAAAQAAIDDWDERYYGPLGSAPSTRPGGGSRVQGDLYFDTGDNQMKVWNNAASQWDDVASSASSNIVTLSPSFDGSETEFTCSTVPVDAQSLLLSINGVIQKPNSGTSTPSEGYVKLANGKIKLAAAPASGADYFAVSLGNTVSVGTPSPDTVGTTELKDNEVTEVKLKIHAAPSGTDKFLAYTSNGMEWAVPSTISFANDANNRVVTGDGSGGLNGEANLTFDGSTLNVNGGTGNNVLHLESTDGTCSMEFYDNATTNGNQPIIGAIGNNLFAETGGSERLRITSDGKVGIGLASPSYDLHVKGAGGSTTVDIENATGWSQLRLTGAGSANYITSDDALSIYVNDLERIKVDTNGYAVFRNDSTGGATAIVGFGYHSWEPKTQVLHGQGLAVVRAGDVWGGALLLASSRGTYASPSASNSGDRSGGIYFCAHDGTDYKNYTAAIESFVSDSVASNDTPGYLRFLTTSDGSNSLSESMRLHTSGDCEIINGDLKVANTHGISFAATGEATGMINELLDDYEEGTFTPSIISDGGTNPTQSYGYRYAYYTRIGNIVHCKVDISFESSGVSSGTGGASIADLPFVAGNAAHSYGTTFSAGYATNWGSNNYPTAGYAFLGTAKLYLMSNYRDDGDTYTQCSSITNNTRLICGFTYMVS